MRIFVAIKVSDDLRDPVLSIQRSIPLNVRWISPDNLHITLIPPWEAGESETGSIVEKLMKVSPPKTLVRFKSISFGPSPKEPRLIWMTADATNELSALKRDIEAALGINSPQRAFIPHITIARFRPEEFSEFNVKELNIEINMAVASHGYSLIRSTFTKEGAIYSAIKDFK